MSKDLLNRLSSDISRYREMKYPGDLAVDLHGVLSGSEVSGALELRGLLKEDISNYSRETYPGDLTSDLTLDLVPKINKWSGIFQPARWVALAAGLLLAIGVWAVMNQTSDTTQLSYRSDFSRPDKVELRESFDIRESHRSFEAYLRKG